MDWKTLSIIENVLSNEITLFDNKKNTTYNRAFNLKLSPNAKATALYKIFKKHNIKIEKNE